VTSTVRGVEAEDWVRVLITGGYGCIGSWIAKQLLDRRADVWVYDLKQDQRRMELVLSTDQLQQVRFVEGDVADLDRVVAALREHRITHLVHLAGLQVPACRANPILGARVNVIGTLCMFEATKQLGGQIERLVYASSAAVYGEPDHYPPGPLPVNSRLLPSTHYGAFKVCNETNARVYWLDHQVPSIGLRPWTVYGVGRDQGVTSEPTKAIKAVAVGRSYHISYGGRQDLQFVEDVAGTFVRCLEVPYRGAGVYNLRGAVVDLPEFHRTLVSVAPEAAELITYGERQLPIAFDLDDAMLHRDIGSIPRTPLAGGIRRTLEHFRKLQGEGRLDTSEL
jgi:nucleoside-diphosphate-sugar epimerase